MHKKQIKKSNIFIHIPKTGGTTINCAMNNSEWQTTPDFNYRHIDYKTKRSNSADIFNPLKYELYEQHNIFMLLRHPIDRLLSEYSFIKTRPEFMNLIKPTPKDFDSYIKNKQTQNYMIGFLVGKRMYDTSFVDRDDLELVKNAIRNINIKVGIFDHYAASLSYFSEYSNLKWPKKIDIKRITLNRPTVADISEETKLLILKNNALDLNLYQYALDIFNSKIKNISNKKVQFKGNKYDYVLEKNNISTLISRMKFKLGYSDYDHKELEPDGAVGAEYIDKGTDGKLEFVHSYFNNSPGVFGVNFGKSNFSKSQDCPLR